MSTLSPRLSRITIYPVKALDGLTVSESRLTQGGALEFDRAFAIFDSEGNVVNGKRNERVHKLRSHFDPASQSLTLSVSGSSLFPPQRFSLQSERRQAEAWLANYFGFAVAIRENLAGGFPDDSDAPGPTVISTATLEAVASWYPQLDVENIRRRFRANLEIGGVPAFWEERLYGAAGQSVAFQIGGVMIGGTNPCQRCVVPTRDPLSGQSLSVFQQTFIQQRKKTLPGWANVKRFNHFYRLAVNTRVAPSEAGKTLKVGDEVR